MGRVFWEATEHAACMEESGKALLSVTFEQRLKGKEEMWMSGGSPSMPGMLGHLPCGRVGERTRRGG